MIHSVSEHTPDECWLMGWMQCPQLQSRHTYKVELTAGSELTCT
jgi:hypothetical protein